METGVHNYNTDLLVNAGTAKKLNEPYEEKANAT